MKATWNPSWIAFIAKQILLIEAPQFIQNGNQNNLKDRNYLVQGNLSCIIYYSRMPYCCCYIILHCNINQLRHCRSVHLKRKRRRSRRKSCVAIIYHYLPGYTQSSFSYFVYLLLHHDILTVDVAVVVVQEIMYLHLKFGINIEKHRKLQTYQKGK